MEIRQVTSADELRPLMVLKRERVELNYNPSVQYIGAFIDGNIVGVVGCQRLGKHLLRYKSAGVLKEYRGRGIYTALWKAREQLCNTGADTITAFCTAKSLPMFLAHGFRKVSERNGITFVKRD